MSAGVESHATRRILDLLRIHVVWADGSKESARIAELVSKHFDGIGMERDGVAYRVPVRFASAPWDSSSHLPADIDLDRAENNAIVLLHDDVMQDRVDGWSSYLQRIRKAIAARNNVDFIIPFGSPSGDPVLPSDSAARIQYVYRKAWSRAQMPAPARDSRLLLHIIYQIRRLLALQGGGMGRRRYL